MRQPTAIITSALAAHTCLAALYYPTPQASFLEHILVDNWGAHACNFSSAITPCNNYVTEVGEPAANSGRTTAAQWMRVAFHDFVTADAGAGTGGIDASIGFETQRGENSGSAFNDSFTFWAPFVNDAVSMADLVALGTVMSMGLCGGQRVPYRPGRIDAVQADPTTGVPAPETDLEETLVLFERAGFNQADSIGLTACGHTMGSVHHGGFPDVVPGSAVTPNNTNGGSNFDISRAVFDTKVVHEYNDWAGNRGGPLVTTENVTTRSDLRLYESDGNATMQALYDSGDGFLSTCVDLMGRMINTVPVGVQLGQPVEPLGIKPVNVTFDIDSQGGLVLAGKIRILNPPDGTTLQATLVGSEGVSEPVTLEPEPAEGSSVYGHTIYYSFSAALQQDASYAALEINQDVASPKASFALQNSVFIVPSKTSVDGSMVNFTVAARPALSSVKVHVSAPVRQHGTLAPKIMWHEADAKPDTTYALPVAAPGYQLWEGSLDLGVPVTGAVAVAVAVAVAATDTAGLVDGGGVVRDVLYLSAGAAGW